MSTVSAGPGPRWKAIYEALCAELPSYSYGSDFYTISDVCRRFEVSKITAIRVLAELANDGLIQKIPGKGNVVRQVSSPAMVRLITPVLARKNLQLFDPVVGRLFRGLTDAAARHRVDFEVLSETHLQKLPISPGRPVGVCMLRRIDPESLAYLRQKQVPHVMIDPLERLSGVSYVKADRRRAGYLATKHLLDHGHRRIAWINGPINQLNFRQRLLGYRDALAEQGIKFDWSLICQSLGHEPDPDLPTIFDNLWSLRRRPTALLCGDDARATQLLDICRQRGIKVPGDLSLVGYPNNSESGLTDPPLTCIDAHFETIAESAFKLLLEQIERASPTPRRLMVSPDLVVRSTVAPPPTRSRKRQAIDQASTSSLVSSHPSP